METTESSTFYEPNTLHISSLNFTGTFEGCIFVDSRAVIPRTCQDQMLKLLHQGHIGINRMKSLARSSVWWPKMDSQIEEFVKECSPCMHHQTAPPAENTPWPRTNQPWLRVHVDHFYFGGDCYLLVVDANSNWIEVFPVRGTTSQENIKPLRECFARYGLPQCLVSDNGPPFNSLEFKEFLRKNNVYHLTSPAYNPSSNGIAEVSVRIIKKSLEKSLEESPNSNMDCILQNVLFNYRNTPTSFDKPPVERLLSYVPRTFVNCLNSEFIQRTFGRNECGRRHFQVGDKVLFTRVIQNRRKWFKAQVIRRLGYNVYLVKNLKGTFKVHVNQMRSGSDTKYAEDSDWTLDNAGAGPHRLEQDPQISTSPPPRRSTRPRCPPCQFSPTICGNIPKKDRAVVTAGEEVRGTVGVEVDLHQGGRAAGGEDLHRGLDPTQVPQVEQSALSSCSHHVGLAGVGSQTPDGSLLVTPAAAANHSPPHMTWMPGQHLRGHGGQRYTLPQVPHLQVALKAAEFRRTGVACALSSNLGVLVPAVEVDSSTGGSSDEGSWPTELDTHTHVKLYHSTPYIPAVQLPCNKAMLEFWTSARVPLQGYGGAASVLMLESAAKASASMLGTASNYRQSQTFTKVCLDHNAMINESCTPIPHSMRSDVDLHAASPVAQNKQGRGQDLGRGFCPISIIQSPQTSNFAASKQLRILQCNINGLCSTATKIKLEEIMEIAEKQKIQIIALQETKLNEKYNLIYSFGNAYTPQQNLTIDEAMCPFRGRVGFRVYIKGKPHKYDIKIFQICEAVSGYAYNLDIYTGKDPEQPEHNSIPNLVDRLAKRFYGQGYHIYFDRWFSSPELFDKLWEKKTLAVGTVMPSRKTMPKTEFSQKLKRGEIIKMRRKHLLAIKWKHVRDVFMLSTVHEGKMMPVKPKTPTREELFKPDAVIDYNKGKVGVDRSDQMMAYYSFSRKTLKWWKKIFFHLFSLCFVNGNIIYNKANPDKKISLKDFYLAVGGELLNQASIEHSEKETTSKTDVARLLGKHYCYKIAPESGKAVQRRCKVCADSAKHKTGKAARKDTRFECKQCKIPLCGYLGCETNVPQSVNIPNTSDLEAQGIKVYLSQNKTINIFNMYHPPNNKLIDDGTMAQFLTDNTIIVGDLNAKHQLWGCSMPNPRGKILSNIFDDNAFMCLNDGNPTHHSYSYNTAQALDISFSSPDIFHKCKWQILKSIGSDHLPILIEISTKTKTSSIKEKFWNFKKANWNLYQKNTNEDFRKAPTRIKDLEQNWISFKNTIIKAAKVSIPRGNIKKWIPNYTHQAKDIQTLITKRNELQKKCTQTKQIVELN
ncbi:hypothetical protein LAZ67_3005233 [Cordylochernes scorpioides]|uniref:Integrase catalytic domain-containing protein n=1 Tax=Cordylochernes scorpioides TaxID=51811 RepID=A0ABY6KDK1_9ARAC|nr:hypothetical protein LAZ67_3005233 [Cordylochernes scorpioides]